MDAQRGLKTAVVAVCLLVLPVFGQYGGGSGTAEDPYLIWSAAQMNAIGANQSDWDKHFRLVVDIDLGGFTGTSFNIIGTHPNDPFTGVFDGDGRTISNFTYTSTGRDTIGLFAYVDGPSAEIKDLGLINAEVDAGTGGGVGSLVGYNRGTLTGCHVEGGSVSGINAVGGLVGSGGTITGCYSKAVSVSGDDSVGGLVGGGGTITDCYSEAVSVSGDDVVGGLVGHCNTITNCSSNGTVSARGSYWGRVGGLVGWSDGTITNCYSQVNVSASTSAGWDWGTGGLVGHAGGHISNCYATGSVSGVDRVGGLVGYNRSAAIANCYSTGSVTGVAGGGGLVGHNSGVVSASFWDTQTSGQSTSGGGTGKTTAEMQDINTFLSAGWDFVNQADGPSDDWAEPPGGGYMICWWQLPENELPALPTFSGGTGEPNDPYLISTASELNRIGHNPRLMAACPHFKLVNDIDLAGIDFFFIGSQGHNYSGVFDGNGHTVSNFTYSSTERNNIGLFGGIRGEDAEVKDLGLIDPNIDAGTGDYIGSLVGRLDKGTITGCYVEGGTVSGDNKVGGLVGENLGAIADCRAVGSVSGGVRLGGLVGENSGTITNCHSSGIVLGRGVVGGLVAGGGIITDCYSTATVSGEYSGVGGLVGYGDTVTNCYATGDVTGLQLVGGLAGEGSNFTNCYATGNVSATNRHAGGLTGLAHLRGTVTNCYSTGSVSAPWGVVGGLMGENQGGTITNCYATGNVQGDNLAGGLVGENVWGGIVTNCYSTGYVTGTTEVGGLMGRNKSGTISAAFWDIQTSGRSNMCGSQESGASGCDDGNGKTTAEMQMESTFTSAGWDFTSPVWTIDEGVDYPRLAWESGIMLASIDMDEMWMYQSLPGQ
ncbi:MAG: hypothetical protein JSV99_00560, partial [Planctomycetota bacterium]